MKGHIAWKYPSSSGRILMTGYGYLNGLNKSWLNKCTHKVKRVIFSETKTILYYSMTKVKTSINESTLNILKIESPQSSRKLSVHDSGFSVNGIFWQLRSFNSNYFFSFTSQFSIWFDIYLYVYFTLYK